MLRRNRQLRPAPGASPVTPAIFGGGVGAADAGAVWIEARDPTDGDFAILQERFGLHELAVMDAMRPSLAPRVDVYDDQIFVVLKSARLENDEIRYAGMDVFVSRQRIITVRHGDRADAGEALRGGSQRRPDFVLHAIMDRVVNSYFPVVEMVEEEVFSMERHLLDSFLDRNQITSLFRLRREAIHLQHVLAAMSDVCGKLANLKVPCIGAHAKPFFRDVHERLVRLNAMTGGLVEVVRAVFEASNLLEQQRQGATTRQLAAWAAILAVPAAAAGVYSIHGGYGYPLVVAAMLAACAGLYLRFKRLRWL